MSDIEHAGELAAGAADRTERLIDLLERLDSAELDAPSVLPGWSRLTIVCHLRYGTHAILRMTRDVLAGRETAYYPDGRAAQRPATLRPDPGESASDVLHDLRSAGAELDREWSLVTDQQWRVEVSEPADNPDLGPVPLARLALARLTELEVHGTDLDIGAPDWTPTLVRVALPTRLAWLRTRRVNHRSFDESVRGSWRLRSAEGLDWFIAVDGERVTSRPAVGTDDAAADISGSGRDLLALLLGRPPREELHFAGDLGLARSFARAFPGP